MIIYAARADDPTHIGAGVRATPERSDGQRPVRCPPSRAAAEMAHGRTERGITAAGQDRTGGDEDSRADGRVREEEQEQRRERERELARRDAPRSDSKGWSHRGRDRTGAEDSTIARPAAPTRV